MALKLLRRKDCGTRRIQERPISNVAFLKSWNIDEFRHQAFNPQIPCCLPKSIEDTPAASYKWFSSTKIGLSSTNHEANPSAMLNSSFWHQYAETAVPLEITSKDAQNESAVKFERITAPLELLLQHIRNSSSDNISVYLAQHDLRDLPKSLQDDLPTPRIVKLVGKGDIYSSSLWLGRSPTYTPLHRDPNPNLFVQLAGTKVIRLFSPNTGAAIFEHTRQRVATSLRDGDVSTAGGSSSATFRGEEMMQGLERNLLHDLVWIADPDSKTSQESIMAYAHQATVTSGQALFIPKGWWHSVKGIGTGITASANWWFR